MDEAQSPDTEIISKNYAEDLDHDELVKIGSDCKQGYEVDLASRSDWDDALQEWLKLANQHRDAKSFPWAGASNVKYPLLTTAAMQFAARAYPSLVPSNGKIVVPQVVGRDPDGAKYEKGERVAKYMSYQILNEMDGWEEDMDKMLMMLPVVGCVFKKTWYNKNTDQVCSKFILPQNFVVNYWTKTLDTAERTSELIEMSRRVLKEYQNQGIFLDVDLGQPVPSEQNNGYVTDDPTVPYTLVEQHTFLDLDDDGYPEPYIVTFELQSAKVLGIYRRHTLKDVVLQEGTKKVAKIVPTQMYTKFGFVPNPDGSFYDIGFGVLLGPINESVNTLINQLVDGGTLSNLQAGFIGKSLKLKMGDGGLMPGEWKPVNATGDDLRKQIVPLPAKEPSNVLFQLMGSLITSGKELASVAEIFTGKMPGQNTPATTTMATVEQGMKVFTAVYKRIYRSLNEEFLKIFKLNRLYLDPNKYVSVLDETYNPEDFDYSVFDIIPGADPTAVSQSEKLMKAQGLMEMMQAFGPILNPVEVATRILEAQEQPNWQKLFSQEVLQTGQVPPPPPDPKMLAIQAKAQADQQKTAMDMQAKQADMEFKARDHEQQMAMEAQKHAQDMQNMQEQTQVKAASELAMSRIYQAAEANKAKQDMGHAQAQHEQKLTHAKEQAKLSQNQNGKSGKSTR